MFEYHMRQLTKLGALGAAAFYLSSSIKRLNNWGGIKVSKFKPSPIAIVIKTVLYRQVNKHIGQYN